MRTATKTQLQLGELDIANIHIDPRSRDDIPQLLRGLQYLYSDDKLRKAIFQILEKLTSPKVSTELGRPGMMWWKILVMGTLRLNLNCDYDRLQELVNHHNTIRQMLGHGFTDDDKTYSLQTLKDNVQLFTPEILDEINQVVVGAGLKLKKKTAWRHAAILLWLKPMCIIRRILICYLMPCGKPLRSLQTTPR